MNGKIIMSDVDYQSYFKVIEQFCEENVHKINEITVNIENDDSQFIYELQQTTEELQAYFEDDFNPAFADLEQIINDYKRELEKLDKRSKTQI